MNSKNSLSIARRYAKSLIELMLGGDCNQAEIKNELQNIKEILQNSPDLNSAMNNPIVSAKDKEEIINAVFEKDTKATTRNFLKLLVEKNRFNLIFMIIDAFNKMLDKINNITQVSVIGAVELEDNSKQEIENKLKEKLNKEINIAYSVDDSIIAGLIYKIEDNILDTSLKFKLEELKKELIK